MPSGSRGRPGAAAVASLAVLLAGEGGAWAAEPPDTTYGRVEGDLTAVAGAGATVAHGGPRGEGELRLRYLETAGVFASYEDGPLVGSRAEPARVLAAGLELRPLFLYRWLEGYEIKRARLDLFVDSFGFELGAAFQQPSGTSFEQRPSLQFGLMLELPLFAQASGPWIGLHGGGRWSDRTLAQGSTSNPDDQSLYLSVTVSWHQVVLSHAVDVGDRRAE